MFQLIIILKTCYISCMQTLNPIVKQIGQLINVRFKTFEMIIKAEISAAVKASEDRVTRNFRGEIKASEERLTNNLQGVEDKLTKKLQVVEDKLTKKLQVVEDKLDGKVNNHEKRIGKLEEHASLITAKN